MDKLEQQEYEALLEMFNSKGWEIYSKQWEDTLKQMIKMAPDYCITNDTWQYQRGAIDQIKRVTGYEHFTRVSLEQVENEDAPV